jgi:hypothetical protein
MKKYLLKIFLLLTLIFGLNISFVWAVNLDFEWKNQITSVSIWEKWWDFNSSIDSVATSVFKTFKIIVWWLLVIYLVYAWVTMILSMWDDDKKLSSAKNSLWYAIVWLLFINIPWTLYQAFTWKRTADSVTWTAWTVKTVDYQRNIFINTDVFWDLIWNILTAMQILVVAAATFMIVLQWINIMKARWEDGDIQEAKNKIIYSIMWLIFVWIMVVWKNIAFLWDANAWRNLFATLANLALFFAWPIAIFFLSMAWYYYITSAWDEEKVKKAKSIVINTLFATLILLWMYTFLLELKTFKL